MGMTATDPDQTGEKGTPPLVRARRLEKPPPRPFLRRLRKPWWSPIFRKPWWDR